jgi:hypothetical protein
VPAYTSNGHFPWKNGLGTPLASAVVMRRTAPVIAACAVAAIALVESLGASPTPWAKLHRPLKLAPIVPGAACPISRVDRRVDWQRVNIYGGSGIGHGPVYPGLGSSGGRLTATRDVRYGGAWSAGKVFWYVRPTYRGRVLIRGRRLDGPQRLGFDGRRVPAPELHIEPYDTVSWEGQPPGSRGIASDVRLRASGCYGVQIDGTTFSRVVIFTVVGP